MPPPAMFLVGNSTPMPQPAMFLVGNSTRMPQPAMFLVGNSTRVPPPAMFLVGNSTRMPPPAMVLVGNSSRMPQPAMVLVGNSTRMPPPAMVLVGNSSRMPQPAMVLVGNSSRMPQPAMFLVGNSTRVPPPAMFLVGNSTPIPPPAMWLVGNSTRMPPRAGNFIRMPPRVLYPMWRPTVIPCPSPMSGFNATTVPLQVHPSTSNVINFPPPVQFSTNMFNWSTSTMPVHSQSSECDPTEMPVLSDSSDWIHPTEMPPPTNISECNITGMQGDDQPGSNEVTLPAPEKQNFPGTLGQTTIRPRPNYFLAVQITNPEIKHGLSQVLASVEEADRKLKPTFIDMSRLHITLMVMNLPDKDSINRAKTGLKEFKQKLNEKAEKKEVEPLTFDVTGLGNFRHQVVFAKVAEGPSMERLYGIADLAQSSMLDKDIAVLSDFNPHVTIMKMSKGMKELKREGIKKIGQELYKDFSEKHFGPEIAMTVQLCSMNKPKVNGYYHIEYEVSLCT